MNNDDSHQLLTGKSEIEKLFIKYQWSKEGGGECQPNVNCLRERGDVSRALNFKMRNYIDYFSLLLFCKFHLVSQRTLGCHRSIRCLYPTCSPSGVNLYVITFFLTIPQIKIK